VIVNPDDAGSASHTYSESGTTYNVKVVTLNDNHDIITYTTDEDPDLEITTL
jgi:hypothetical protein